MWEARKAQRTQKADVQRMAQWLPLLTLRHYAFIAPDDVGAKVLAIMEPPSADRVSTSAK